MFEQVLEEAYSAANQAQEEYLKQFGGVEPQHGACGFAWVHIPDARVEFVKWCKKEIKKLGYKYDTSGNLVNLDGSFTRDYQNENYKKARDYGHPHWKKGWEFWGPGNFRGQLIYVKEEGAQAFKRVLNENGIVAHFGSRLD